MTARIITRVTYILRGEPSFVVDGPRKGTFQHATFTADRPDGTMRSWQVREFQLFDVLSRLMGPGLAQTACNELNEGRATQLPGTYSAYDLVQLGYRDTRAI